MAHVQFLHAGQALVEGMHLEMIGGQVQEGLMDGMGNRGALP